MGEKAQTTGCISISFFFLSFFGAITLKGVSGPFLNLGNRA